MFRLGSSRGCQVCRFGPAGQSGAEHAAADAKREHQRSGYHISQNERFSCLHIPASCHFLYML
jgi:hypothetical protein